MTLAANQVSFTPGSGVDFATLSKGSKEHSLVVPADADGHMFGSSDVFIAQTGNTIHVAAAGTDLFEMFNSDVFLKVDILGIYIIPALVAVTGVGLTYDIIRTSAIGTGGTGITPVPANSAQSALSDNITARTKPTGGATASVTIMSVNGSSEETSPYAAMASNLNHMGVFQQALGKPFRLNQNEGIKVRQTTSSAVGNVNIICIFRVV